MGKAGRRNKNRQKRKQKSGSDPIAASGTADESAAVLNPQSALLKLRHADPKTRHAALVALQASVISQLRCNPRQKQQPISAKVLQAVREQVTSSDLECSAVAAECLAQYLGVTATNTESDQRKQTTASWAIVFLGRLETCWKALGEQDRLRQEQLSQKKHISKNQQKKAERTRKQWYAVAAPCFRALCKLIETNGHALDRLSSSNATTFVQVVFGMLSLECQTATEAAATAGNASNDDTEMGDATTNNNNNGTTPQQLPHDALFVELRETTALYASRCLHSALDDNPELAAVLEGKDYRDPGLWKTLLASSTSTIDTTNGKGNPHKLSVSTRLHLIGCLVNLYQMSWLSGGGGGSQWYEEIILEHGILAATTHKDGLLFEVLRSSASTAASPPLLSGLLAEHETKYREAQALLQKQTTDQRLENEIVTKVDERKEPAKLIARRQKKIKDAKREAFREQQKARMIAEAEAGDDDNDDMEMEDATNDKIENPSTSGKIVREQDGEEAVSEALLGFTGITGPAQLGLEILTNLVSTWIAAPAEEGEDAAMGNDVSNSKLAQALKTDAVASKLAEALRGLWEFLKSSCQATNADDPIRTDAEETLGKVSACIVNCLLSGMIVDGIGWNKLWETTVHVLRAELESSNTATPQASSAAILDACASILAVVVEVNPSVLQQPLGGTGNWIDVCRALLPRADAVCLLSAGVRHGGSAIGEEVVRSLTQTLLGLLPPCNHQVGNTARIMVLKTFMDWYGNDDFYPKLYESLMVSEDISACLAHLANQQDPPYDEEQLQILHNSERFLEYKKQLRL